MKLCMIMVQRWDIFVCVIVRSSYNLNTHSLLGGETILNLCCSLLNIFNLTRITRPFKSSPIWGKNIRSRTARVKLLTACCGADWLTVGSSNQRRATFRDGSTHTIISWQHWQSTLMVNVFHKIKLFGQDLSGHGCHSA